MAYRVLSVIPEVRLFALSLEGNTYVYLDIRNSQNSINVTAMSESYSRACTMRLILHATKIL